MPPPTLETAWYLLLAKVVFRALRRGLSSRVVGVENIQPLTVMLPRAAFQTRGGECSVSHFPLS